MRSGYVGQRSSRPPRNDYRPDYMEDRRPIPADEFFDYGYGGNNGEFFEQPGGQYAVQPEQDFFAEEPELPPERPAQRESTPLEPDMDDDFDDDEDPVNLSDFDDDGELDEWLDTHEASHRQPRDEKDIRSARSRGWSEENGFDGFEDDEDIRRAGKNSRSYGGGPFEESDRYQRAPVMARDDRPVDPAANRKRAIFICLGGLAVIVVSAVLLLTLFRGPSSPLGMDMVLDAMTVEQAETIIGGFIDRDIAAAKCTVTVDNRTETIDLAGCEITYVGHDASRVSEYITDTDDTTGALERIEYSVSGALRYNKTALRAFLDSLCGESSVPVVDPYFEIDYETSTMTVYPGKDGWGVDVESFLSQVASSVAASGGDMKIVCSAGTVKARELSAEEIYKQAATDPADAYTTTDSAGQTIYHSEINGIEFDQAELARQIAAGGSQWQIPVKVTLPKINLKDIRKYTFPDVLGTYYTYYSEGNRERSHNVALSAELINSMILEPGDQFSFNDRVGERTADRGFKRAGVYAGEGTTEDYGGGICQTSSTLYYTCILANLQIDERRNHMYTVGYMQTAVNRSYVFGNDATVNWGSADFKFTNSKEYPIRIDIWAQDGVLTCEIRGTADGYTADFKYDYIDSTPYKIKYLPDNGSKDQAGQDGYKINVYRVIYKDGEEIDRVLESRNTYMPMNKLIYTNEIPAGFEYGVEYDQNYTPAIGDPGTETTTTTQTTPPESDVEIVG